MEDTYGVWEYKGKRYFVYSSQNNKAKNPDTGEWFNVVEYRPMLKWVCEDTGETSFFDDYSTVYYRERQDFLKKFTRVLEEEDETLPN